MYRLRSFLLLTVLGGLTVILPFLLFLALTRWLLARISGFAEPLTALFGERFSVGQPLALVISVGLLLAFCFLTGLLIRTRIGALLHEHVDEWFGSIAPGYRMVRDTVAQLIAPNGGSLRGEVALVRLGGAESPAAQIGIVTARHGETGYTVYIPTAPLPTQGFVYHLPASCVQVLIGISIESAMRMVFSCGRGAPELLEGNIEFRSTGVVS